MGNLLGMIAQTAGNIGNKIFAHQDERRQYRNQNNLMDKQMNNQMKLNEQGQQLQMKTWKETNYPAQLEMMKEAGLNPALMYQQGGSNGTTGSQGGGSAASGSSQQKQSQPMDIGNQMMIASQMKLQAAQAEKLKAEADSIRGEEGTTGAADIASKEMQTKLNKLFLEIGQATKQDQIDSKIYEVENLIKQGGLTDAQIENVKADTLQKSIENKLTNAKVGLTTEQTQAIGQEVKQGWEKINVALQGLEIQNQSNKLRGIEGKTKVQEIKQNYMIALLQNTVAWGKLNIEQQKVLVSTMSNIIGLGGSKTTTQKWDSKGGTSTTESTTSKY